VRRVVVIAAAIAMADQLTKWLAVTLLGQEESRVVINGLFNLVNWRNPGAAWGIFQESNHLLAVISVLTVLALYVFRRSFQVHRPACGIALGLIAGGIVGNVIDRVRLGHVVDFLDFHIGARHWPAFNLADSAICIGVALYIIASWRAERQARTAGASAQPHIS